MRLPICLTSYLYLQSFQSVHVGIVGAGIGGLAAAIAFRRAGVNVTVLEAADELLEVSQPACHVNGEYHP